ncbi:MAG: EamA family transporter [Bacteroidetes bacterium]|nr:EamA family transporter [Bacteroidota bacterium]
MKSPSLANWLTLIFLSLIWGSSFILIKKGLQGFGFVEAASIRLMAGGLVFLPFGIYHAKNIPKKSWPYVVLVTFVGMFIPAFLFCLAQQHVQSAVAGIMNALTPVFTFVFSIFLFKKAYRLSHVAGLLLGLVCATMLIVERSDDAFSLNIYAGLIVLATICYGLNINLVKNFLGDVSSVALSTVSVSLGGFFLSCSSFCHAMNITS